MTINGNDAYNTYGIVLTERSYLNLVGYAPLKSVDYVDWPEEDGLDVDLSNPVLDKRTITLEFASTDPSKLALFFTEITGTGYHAFTVLGNTYNLRLIEESRAKKIYTLKQFTLRFSEDKPLDGYSYVGPTSGLSFDQGFSIDGVNLNDYRILVLRGSEEEIDKQAPIKENLLRNSKYSSGQTYDTGLIKIGEKTVTLSLLLAADQTTFWRNYKAFLFDLIRADKRVLITPSGSFDCYYNIGIVRKFTDSIWCEFDLKLTFI